MKYWLAILTVLFSMNSMAVDLRVAVSANFKPVLEHLAEQFNQQTGNKVTVSSASTGVLYNQIMHGAPFDLFFSADQARPLELEKNGKAFADSRKTYAYGRLVLWDRSKDHKKPYTVEQLKGWKGKLAIANPKTAPYGLAAEQSLEKLGLWQGFHGRLVQGANIQQTWQFVASGNVEMGLVALSQLKGDELKQITHVPEKLYEPIRQDMVILKSTKNGKAARAFSDFVLSSPSQNYIAEHGYFPSKDKAE
ncbi:molybdate ABC transporter substrate-binding protein [Endozoicomonas arenosclerae]|uniref:molybdate ABC transporter substrate-binding protein n=1 Tax=Endozoicomonas arenosclerae TaxID=1633495 RepID=UPI0007806487|nr:molybdate ABC transporter substrate-binding protein [Endozoicomonas arenosclerae]